MSYISRMYEKVKSDISRSIEGSPSYYSRPKDLSKYSEYEKCILFGIPCEFGICSECEEYHNKGAGKSNVQFR